MRSCRRGSKRDPDAVRARPPRLAQRLARQDHRAAATGVVAFGGQARRAVGLWDSKPDVPVCRGAAPVEPRPQRARRTPGGPRSSSCAGSSHPTPTATRPDPTTAAEFSEADYAPIPPRDLPFGVPDWLGDDNWGRTARPKHNNSVERPGDDLLHTLIWQAPANQP